MLEHKKLQKLNDYFTELNSRQPKSVYFYRINGYSEDIDTFIKAYYEEARKTGVVIEGKIPNPDGHNLSYYGEVMGNDFRVDRTFVERSLRKWLPRMNDAQRTSVTDAIYNTLTSMQTAGKTLDMLKNAYTKFMCWLYYRFERIVTRLGENKIPKILYEGDISRYELMMLTILSGAGCDIVLLQYGGDAGYLRLDAESKLSVAFPMDGLKAFPQGYSLKKVQQEIRDRQRYESLYGAGDMRIPCTNTWISGKGLEDIRKSVLTRGTDSRFFYNCFIRINGVEDKLTYMNELYQLQLGLKKEKRQVVVVNRELSKPTPDEIAGIKRGQYQKQDHMIMDLAGNIRYSMNPELQQIMRKAFVEVLLTESEKKGSNLNKLTNMAVYLLCWLNRYLTGLFRCWKAPEIACFLFLGGCGSEGEALFFRFLARLPVDVVLLHPNLNVTCCLTDSLLYEVTYAQSLEVDRYPEEQAQVQMGTAAYHAERELDTLMYQDSGIYRNQQFGKANSIQLQTMYEEIRILWGQELKYRPNFEASNGVVTIPVIFSKVSGVKDGLLPQYWQSIRELVTDNTVLISKPPYIDSMAPNPIKAFGYEFFKNGKLQRAKIKSHQKYPYGILREETQDHILDKLQLMIDRKLIRGIGENGMEYTVVSSVLNLPKEIIREIQSFDFTKKNPKLIYINTSESKISLEDSIMAVFLNLIGFDILFYIPTGYQNVEVYMNHIQMDEHQIGEYLYDLQVPDLKSQLSKKTRRSLRDRIFHR